MKDMDKLHSIPVENIYPDTQQDRQNIDQKKLEELASSIRTSQQVFSPLSVKPHPSEANKFILIGGERRWRAAKLAGMQQVPVIVRNNDAKANSLEMLIDNLLREDLSGYELSYALQKRLNEGWTTSDLAKHLGKSKPWVSKYTSIFKLNERIQALYKEKIITDISKLQRLAKLPEKTLNIALKKIREGENATEVLKVSENIAKYPEPLQDAYADSAIQDLKLLKKASKLDDDELDDFIKSAQKDNSSEHLSEFLEERIPSKTSKKAKAHIALQLNLHTARELLKDLRYAAESIAEMDLQQCEATLNAYLSEKATGSA
ncbi:ParB/RepB/Spo0J family partition protein [Zooshikella sp. RANM57]|uniref:ParB/RepB/Spo0J family partition protein n=1 Tax=Zooshikella sp. RANM57 TaxID=3425863 RepID=UPI003D6E4FB6